jgi:hypothetical protein
MKKRKRAKQIGDYQKPRNVRKGKKSGSVGERSSSHAGQYRGMEHQCAYYEGASMNGAYQEMNKD